MIAAALIGAIAWNLLTWYYGLPSSSSHALIGGLFGATLISAGTGAFKVQGILEKVLFPMVASPLIGFFVALGLVVLLFWLFLRRAASADDDRLQAAADRVSRLHGLFTRLE